MPISAIIKQLLNFIILFFSMQAFFCISHNIFYHISEKRIFPAINIPRSGTRREELLLSKEELEGMYVMRKALGGMKSEEALEQILDMLPLPDNT